MKAVWYEKAGPAAAVLNYGDLEKPKIRHEDEILVRVRASGINPSDTKQRSGMFRFGPPAAYTIPHQDGAGDVVASGRGPSDPLIGTRVWMVFCQTRRAFGTAAEYVVVDRDNVRKLPNHITFEEGACLGVAGLTAFAALTAIRLPQGEWVLVQGGAGAVGGYAVQIARRLGAQVIATASTVEKQAIAARLGANHVLSRTSPSLEDDVVRHSGGGVDRIVEVDFGANVDRNTYLLGSDGLLVSYSSPSIHSPAFPYYPLAM